MPGGPAVSWRTAWGPDLDAALDHLPPAPGCTRSQYRVLAGTGGEGRRHALVSENGAPTAIISLRRRKTFWEPLAYQCLPGVVAPAVSNAALGRALNALGVEVRIPAGLNNEALGLGASYAYPYDVYRLMLDSDYEAHWRLHKQWHMRAVRKARARCADMSIRIDGKGDLPWIIDMWRDMWARDPERETVAAPERLRLWPVLQETPPSEGFYSIHTIQLLQGETRAAGIVVASIGRKVIFQCSARSSAFESFGVGTRVMDAAIAWAAENGFESFDLGGGDYKKSWAPLAPEPRYGAIFQPRMLSVMQRLASS